MSPEEQIVGLVSVVDGGSQQLHGSDVQSSLLGRELQSNRIRLLRHSRANPARRALEVTIPLTVKEVTLIADPDGETDGDARQGQSEALDGEGQPAWVLR
jgi:hypothetical protein